MEWGKSCEFSMCGSFAICIENRKVLRVCELATALLNAMEDYRIARVFMVSEDKSYFREDPRVKGGGGGTDE